MFIRRFTGCTAVAIYAPMRFVGLFAPFGLAVAPRNGFAYLPVVLSVASAVCGLVASRRKGDGGIGAILTASIQFQQVMAEQLQDMQQGMAEILTKVSMLPENVRAALRESRLLTLQSEIGGALEQYNVAVRAAAERFSTYQAWAADDYARRRMANIYARLDAVMATVSGGKWCDAITALYLPPALFASLGAMNLMGQPAQDLKSEAQRYLDLMHRALDPQIENSIGWELERRQASLRSISQSLRDLGVVLPPSEQTSPIRVTLGEINIQHYVPAQPRFRKGCYYEKEVGTNCAVDRPASPEYFGQADGFSFVLTIDVQMVKAPKQSDPNFGVRQFVPSSFEINKGASSSAPMIRANAPEIADRLVAAGSCTAWREADAKATKIRGLITALNNEIALVALNAGAAASLHEARADAFAFFGLKA